jgi:hypothetical protein
MVIAWVEFVTVYLDIMVAIVAKLDVHLAHIGTLKLQHVLITVQQSTIKIFILARVSLVIVVVTSVMASQQSAQTVLLQLLTLNIFIMEVATLLALMALIKMVSTVLFVIQLYFAKLAQ